MSPCAFPRKCPWLVQAFCELALSFTVGWQVRAEDSSQGAYMRFYYCDFLDSKEHRNACERLRNAWRDNQKDAKTYKNVFDCLIKTVKIEGPAAIYKGYWAHYLRIG